MAILVTGGAGFIGSHLCEALLRRGRRVVCLDNFDPQYDPALKRRNVEPLHTLGDFRLVQGDVRNAELVVDTVRHGAFRQVVHLAAKPGVPPSIRAPLVYQEVNVGGTVTLLEALMGTQVEQLVFGSSSSVYGGNTKAPFAEDDALVGQISPYAASKRAAELFCYTHHHLTGLPITCLRFFTVHGERMRPDLAMHLFADMLTRGETIPVYGDPQRDFTYVGDIVDGILAALDRPYPFEIINLGHSQPVAVTDMIEMLAQELGREATIRHVDPRPGDPQITHADIGKARRLLGYEPKVSLREGVRRFAAWYGGERG